MISSWRKKRASRAARTTREYDTTKTELTIPNHFRCPISLDIMKDPVTLCTGITYDRENIETWIESGNITCPMTNQVLRSLEPIPNHTIRRMIQDWCVENRAHGVERIPTPRIPVSSDEVSRILKKISTSRTPQDCNDLVGRIVRLMKESERNRVCIIGNGGSRVLASTFNALAEGEGENVITLLEELMSGLTLMMPLDQEAEGYLKSTRSLDRLIWFMKTGRLSGRINAILILKELISLPRGEIKIRVIETLIQDEEAMEELIKLIKDPICNSSTKASLVIIYHMVNNSQTLIIGKFVEMGLVTLILDILVDAEKGVCERSLAVLDAICRSEIGRESAYNNALVVPVVVKKILRVSDLATEFAVSILWRLCDRETREGRGMVVDALQVGAFQKLLLILQVGWNINEKSKEKVTKLLKLLNLFRDKTECIESIDFKNLKRSF